MPCRARLQPIASALSHLCAALLLAHAGAGAAAAESDLTALSLEQLIEMPVLGASKYAQRPSEVAASVSVITREQMRAFGWRTVEEALTSLPGVYATYDRQYTYLGTRGFGLPGDYNTRVLVTINGNRTNDVTYDNGPFGRQLPIDLDLVERIEYIPGPGGSVYGQNAMFGVVNIVTRSGAAIGGVETAIGWQAPQHRAEGRVSLGRRLDNGTDIVLSAAAMQARGEDLPLDFGAAEVSGIARGLDGERVRQLYARAALDAWSIEWIYGLRRKDDPTGVYLSDPLIAGQYQEDRSSLWQAQYDAALSDPNLRLSARVFFGDVRYGSELRYTTWYAFPARSTWRGFETRLLWTALANHKLLFGIEAQDNARYVQAIRDLSDPANDIVLPGSGWRAGVYGQDEWRLDERWHATLGLRVDRNDATGTAFSPRAALIWQASTATTAKLLYGRAHRAPNAYEREYDDGFAQLGNPKLKGETVDTLELVADHRVNRELALRSALYFWRMHDLIVLDVEPSTGIVQYRSGAEVRARGLEISFDRSFSGGYALRGSLTLQHARQADGSELVNSPARLAKLAFSAPLPGASWHVAYELQAESGRLAIDGSRLGGYAVSNLTLGGTCGARTEWSIGVLNLAAKRYAHPGADSNWQNAIEQDGRALRLQLRTTF